MYAYFGGASIFDDVLPVTGCLQLGIGILNEMYIIWKHCTPGDALWAHILALVLLSTYAVLFSGDLRERARNKKSMDKKER